MSRCLDCSAALLHAVRVRCVPCGHRHALKLAAANRSRRYAAGLCLSCPNTREPHATRCEDCLAVRRVKQAHYLDRKEAARVAA